MPKSSSVSTKAVVACLLTGISTKEKSEAAPSKSRFQIWWPGSFSSAGYMTRFTSERFSSQRATLSAFAICCRMRTPIVRKPRSAR